MANLTAFLFVRWNKCMPVAGGSAWQLPQAGTTGVAGGVMVASEFAIVVMSAGVSVDKYAMLAMLPTPGPIAVVILATVAPALAEVARGPWQFAQAVAYNVEFGVGLGFGVGVGVDVAGVSAVTMACT